MAAAKQGRGGAARKQELFGDPVIIKLGEAIADVVEDVIGPELDEDTFVRRGETVQDKAGELVEPFLQLQPPPCSVRHYIGRITKYSGLSEEALMCMAALVNRVCGNSVLQVRDFVFDEPDAQLVDLSHFNAHRLVLACALLSAKFNDEMHCSNSHWAKVGGVTTGELNDIEKAFLRLTRHRLLVNKQYFKACRKNIWLLSSQQAPQGSPTSVACSPVMTSNLDDFFEEPHYSSDEDSAAEEDARTTLALAGHALSELRGDMDSIRVDDRASRSSGELFDLQFAQTGAETPGTRGDDGICTQMVSLVRSIASGCCETVLPPVQKFTSDILDGKKWRGSSVPESGGVKIV